MPSVQGNALNINNNGLVFFNGTTSFSEITATASGNALLSTGNGLSPAYSVTTYPVATAINQILYSPSSNIIAGLATANNGLLVTSNTGVPSILPGGTTGQVLQANTAAAPSFSTATYPSTATSTGTILRASGTNWVATTSTYPVTNAVSTLLYASASNVMSALSTANDGLLVTSNTGVPSILAGPGTTGQVLQSNASAAPSFSTASYPSTTTINQILYSSAANTVGAITTANNGVLITSNSGVPSLLANGTAGYVLTAQSGAPPAWAAAASGGPSWNDTTGGSANLVKNNGYIADSASLTTFTLSANNAIGDTIYIVGKGAGGWKIVYTTNQYIQFGSSSTTTTTGNLASSNQYDCCTLVCTTASGTQPIFTVNNAVGNLAIT